MVGSRTLLHHSSYVGCFHAPNSTFKNPLTPTFMAEEDPARSAAEEDPSAARTGGASTSRAPGPPDEWLQLGIRTPVGMTQRPRGELQELHLFPNQPSRALYLPPAPQYTRQILPGVAWGAAGTGGGIALPPYLSRPQSAAEMRVIGAPPRPQTGIWFVLLAAQHQEREPYLPQISKSYLRIKDGRMTIRLLMKYLAIKLGLDSESEVGINCRGLQLLPSLTLQHVRDSIWSSRETATAMPVSPFDHPSNHVMTLHYGRTSHTPTQFL